MLIGGGIIKPFQRIEKMVFEALIKSTSPKQILNHLYNQRHDALKIFSRRNKQRLAVWSGAGGIGGLCFEALC